MWDTCTPAKARFQRRMLRFLAVYFALFLSSAWLARHEQPGDWEIYVFAAIPALGILVMMVGVGRYLHEETDEFQRMMVVRSLLVGTAAMLSTIVVSDFLRELTPAPALPPFSSFIVFCVGLGIAQLVQMLRNRPEKDDA